MTSMQPAPAHPPHGRRRSVGLPMIAIVGLALLAVPRVVLHDLGLIESGTLLNSFFVFGPPLIWIAVVVWRRVPNAFVTLLVVGLCYGVFLAIGHQLLWNVSFADDPPTLGGNLADIDAGVSAAIVRAFAVGSSLVTGTLVGAGAGLIAWIVQVLVRRLPDRAQVS